MSLPDTRREEPRWWPGTRTHVAPHTHTRGRLPPWAVLQQARTGDPVSPHTRPPAPPRPVKKHGGSTAFGWRPAWPPIPTAAWPVLPTRPGAPLSRASPRARSAGSPRPVCWPRCSVAGLPLLSAPESHQPLHSTGLVHCLLLAAWARRLRAKPFPPGRGRPPGRSGLRTAPPAQPPALHAFPPPSPRPQPAAAVCPDQTLTHRARPCPRVCPGDGGSLFTPRV